MNREPLIMVCTSDIAGQVRGKGFPARDLPHRLKQGVGWTPTNIQITAFRDIADSPFGPFGDLQLVPDPATEVHVDFGDGSPAEHFFLGDIFNTDGSPWDCCPRHFAKSALAELTQASGLTLLAAFEHEFFYSDGDQTPASAYSLRSWRQQGLFAEVMIYALESAGLQPDTFMAEYGPAQYEVTIAAQSGVKAADHAVILRELVRASARRLGETVSFAPLVTPDIVGNGVHVHLSLLDENSRSVMYDPRARYGLSETAGQFVAGILRHAPALVAFTAPSVASYRRLVPHRWSSAYNNLGYRDREACMRICPIFETSGKPLAEQYNVEYRAADAAASPYLLLGMLARAGLQGIRESLSAPTVTERDLETLSKQELQQIGVQRLPRSLEQALAALQADDAAKNWLPPRLLDVYMRHKLSEIEMMRPLSSDELCARYAQVY